MQLEFYEYKYRCVKKYGNTVYAFYIKSYVGTISEDNYKK